MFQKFIIFFTLISLTLARSASTQLNSVDNDIDVPMKRLTTTSGISSYLNDIKFLYKTYQDCSKIDSSTCLKLKLVTSMDKEFRNVKDINLFDGIKFVQDPNEPIDETPIKTETEIEESLPRSLEDKESVLNGLIMKKIISFFKSHTLQIKFPSAEEYQRSLTEEGRKKNKNNGSMVMIPLLLGGTFIPLAFGALALLAGKALIVSKLALVLASIIGIKKLLSGSQGHGHESAHEVVVSGGHGHTGWGRNYELQNLAYNAYVPKN